MKVAFWSNIRGRSCVTSNLACISVLSILGSHRADHRTIVFENHQNIINLGSALFSQNSKTAVSEKGSYYVESGLSRVLHSLEQGKELPEQSLFHFAEDYLGKQLFYLSALSVENADVLEYRLERECVPAMNYLEKHSDLVMVDTSSAPLISSRKILQQADLVVVNLTQNSSMLDHFFNNYSVIREKAFYLMGDYDRDSKLTKKEIMDRYGISGDSIATIPHNIHFSDAVSEGNLIPFLLQNYHCGENNPDYAFISGAREAANLFCSRLRQCSRAEQ